MIKPDNKKDLINLESLRILDLQPSQFYISEEKLCQIQKWFDPKDFSSFPPIPIKPLDGKLVMTDGHTRAVAALRAGLNKLPLVWGERSS